MSTHRSSRVRHSDQVETLKNMVDLCRRRSYAGDVVNDEEEDPRRRGILRNTSCRRHRERLRSTRQTHILQGLTVLAAAVIILALLLFLALEMAQNSVESEPGQVVRKQQPQPEKSSWLDILGFLGFETQSELQHKDQNRSGKDSCSPQAMDLERIFRQVARQVLNQEQALARMERALAGSSRFRSVALVGPPGVGKTLTATVLRQEFPWPANVHAYSWSTQMADEVGKFRMLRQFVDGLSDCGANLLIIDNLTTCDHGLVPIFNKLILEREGELGKRQWDNQTVLVVYVINVEADQYWEQYELLQQLESDTTIVSFRFFATDDVLDCLDRELKVQQLILSPENQAMILEDAIANVFDRGCKDLRLQILRNGVPDL